MGTCRYCNKGNLRWKQGESGWRLHEGGYPHTCQEYIDAHPTAITFKKQSFYDFIDIGIVIAALGTFLHRII